MYAGWSIVAAPGGAVGGEAAMKLPNRGTLGGVDPVPTLMIVVGAGARERIRITASSTSSAPCGQR